MRLYRTTWVERARGTTRATAETETTGDKGGTETEHGRGGITEALVVTEITGGRGGTTGEIRAETKTTEGRGKRTEVTAGTETTEGRGGTRGETTAGTGTGAVTDTGAAAGGGDGREIIKFSLR